MKELIIAIGLLLFIEGGLYALFPSKMKNMLKTIEKLPVSQLRISGLLFALIGFVNLVIPFFFISYGIKSVQSNLAAILMSSTPLTSTILGHYFTKYEKFNLVKSTGVLVGFLGTITSHPGSALG